MIISKSYEIRYDGVELISTFSDHGLQIIGEDGVAYDSAIDPAEMHRTYIESKFMATDFTFQIEHWLDLIHNEEAYVTDVPEAFRDQVQAALDEEEREQLVQAAKILLGVE